MDQPADPQTFEVLGSTFDEKIKNFMSSLRSELKSVQGEPEDSVRAWLNSNFALLADAFVQQRMMVLPTVFRKKYVKLYSTG